MTGWYVGIALGVVVILIAAAIVITIVALAMRIAKQAATAEEGVEAVRGQTDELGGIARIRTSVNGLLEIAGQVAANTAHIPELEATAPVLGLIVEEAVVQDGYMNALTDGYATAVA